MATKIVSIDPVKNRNAARIRFIVPEGEKVSLAEIWAAKVASLFANVSESDWEKFVADGHTYGGSNVTFTGDGKEHTLFVSGDSYGHRNPKQLWLLKD